MFEFIFQGNFEQFEFFKFVANEKIPNSGLSLSNHIGDEFHCAMVNEQDSIFKMGMIVSVCYNKFGHLESQVQ